MKKALVGLGVTLLCLTATAARSEASLVTLTDANSVVRIDTTSTAGVYDWTVDGVDQLFQQWFWYRLGGATQEYSIDTLGEITPPVIIGPDAAKITLGGAGSLKVEVTYTLIGNLPGSGASHLDQVIKITNLTGSTQTLDFFQYSDFDLQGTNANDQVEIGPGAYGPNTVFQTDTNPGIKTVMQASVSPAPTAWEANIYPATLVKLNDGSVDNLNMNPGPVTGDVTWAFQWGSIHIPNGGNYSFSENTAIYPTPEPASLVLFGMGLIGAAGVARRRKTADVKA
jgi:hypothetical protein